VSACQSHFRLRDGSWPTTQRLQDLRGNNYRISISADRSGHYSGVGMINNQKMAFMIDTGATLVAVPKELAERAG
jgi:aspartyl protease family protein